MKLGDACTILPGGTPKTNIREYWNGTIPWISIKDFADANKYISCTEKTITRDGFENCVSAMLMPDDIILSARGSVGKTAMLQYPMAFNQSCFGLRSKNKNLSQQFLFYWLRSHSNIFRASKQGNIFKTITRDFFDFTEIYYPDLPEQLRIAGILQTLEVCDAA